jgi:rRNA processing protein Krr1/Pno1
MSVEIPNDAVGIIIGKSGQTIRQICERTGAHVQVQRDSEVDRSSPFRIVHVVGPPENLHYAKQEIMILVEVRDAFVVSSLILFFFSAT